MTIRGRVTLGAATSLGLALLILYLVLASILDQSLQQPDARLQVVMVLLVVWLVSTAGVAWLVVRLLHVRVGRQEGEPVYRAIVEQTSEGILLVELETGRIRDANPSACVMLGHTHAESVDRSFLELVVGNEALLASDIAGLSAGGSMTPREVSIRRKDGAVVEVEVGAALIRTPERGLICAVMRDIGDRKSAEERVRFFAYHDALTGLPNRLLFQDRLSVSLAHSDRSREPVGVMFIDLDRFKEVNDTLGHDTGDALLLEVASRLQRRTRQEDTVARQGGDEFLVLLPHLAHTAEVRSVAERLLETLRAPFTLGEHEVRISASIGAALYPVDGPDAATLVRHADVAMYRAKEEGRDGFRLFDTAMNDRDSDRVEIRAGLVHALERNELVLHYQPLVDAKTGWIRSMEALVRWRTPDGALVPPMRFIPVAEETGLIIPIGEWVLNEACRQMAEWRDAGIAPPRVSVNLSPRQFVNYDLVATVTQALRVAGLEPRQLEVEVTEALATQHPEQSMTVLGELVAMGVGVSLDDFGTGHSSLANLRRFPFDRVKIDRTFLGDVVRRPEDKAMIRGMISIAHSLGLEVVAEGVETTAHVQLLSRYGCDLLQGYGLARPVPAEEATPLLARGARLFEPARTTPPPPVRGIEAA